MTDLETIQRYRLLVMHEFEKASAFSALLRHEMPEEWQAVKAMYDASVKASAPA